MITIFNRRAIYIGCSKEEKNKIIKLLTKYKIPYEKKEWDARGGQARGRGDLGQLSEYQTTYEIYVRASDYEECEFLMRQMGEMR